MKKLWKLLSYVLVAVVAAGITFAVTILSIRPTTTKLEQMEALILERFIGDTDQVAIEDAAANAMLSAINDRWSYYIPAAEYEDHMHHMKNTAVGIGVTVQKADTGGLLVIQVTRGGPAQEAGLLAEDVITAVNGTDITALELTEATALVGGEAGTQVRLTVLRGEQTLSFTVTRKTFQTPIATAWMLPGNVGLVTMENFNTRCAEETIAAIDELVADGAVALILDVRNNGGGYVDELVKVLDHLLPEGDLFRSEDYTGKEEVRKSDAAHIDLPMAVLVNGRSYSAAEFFGAALREYDAAILVGEKTSGKGYFQVTYDLVDGSAVALSIGRYFTPQGKCLEGVGLTPDILVEVDDETDSLIYYDRLDPMEDPQIQAALAALTED